MLSRTQRSNALKVIEGACLYGHEHGWGRDRTYQNCRMALMTPMPESSMHNYASANVPESVNYPHDPVSWTLDHLGHDHASMGMFQQQTGWAHCPANGGAARNPARMDQSTMSSPNGWGTPRQLMDIHYQVRAFLDQMGNEFYHGHPATTFITGMPNSLGERCQLVQGSAFPGRYQPYYKFAGRFMVFNLRFTRIWRATRTANRKKV